MTRAAPPATVPAATRTAIDGFARHLAASPATTRGAYLRDVEVLARAAAPRDVATLARADLARALALLHAGGLSGRSLARMLSAWRAFYRFLIAAAARIDNPTTGLRAPKSPKRLPGALSPEEAAKLVAIDGDDFLVLRDRALLELAYSSGLRLSELAGLDVDRVDLVAGEVRVVGKGAKERIVPVGRAALAALRAWLPTRKTCAREEPALFVGERGRRLSRRAIQARLAAHAVKQGLDRHVHPHMLRHSFASHVLQSSGDLRAVQEMLGHASIASTQVYTHLDFQALAKAYDAAHPRARKRR